MKDGNIIYAEILNGTGLWLIPSSGGTPRRISAEKFVDTTLPVAVGTTGHFIFCGVNARDTDLWIGDEAGGPSRKLLEHAGAPSYVAPYLLFVREGTLFAQRFDEKNGSATSARNRSAASPTPITITLRRSGRRMVIPSPTHPIPAAPRCPSS